MSAEAPAWIESRLARWRDRTGGDRAVAGERAEDAVLGRMAPRRVARDQGLGRSRA